MFSGSWASSCGGGCLLRSSKPEPTSFAVDGGELSLPSPALLELLRAVLGKGRPFRFRASGPSMSPCICDGDVILIVPLLPGSYPRLGVLTQALMVQRTISPASSAARSFSPFG